MKVLCQLRKQLRGYNNAILAIIELERIEKRDERAVRIVKIENKRATRIIEIRDEKIAEIVEERAQV